MAAELHQTHLSLSPPPAPLFPTSASILTSPSHSTITQEEEAEEQRNTESTRRMARYMHDHDHLSFQRGDYSENFLTYMETQSGHLDEAPHHIFNSFQNMSLVPKRPTLANHKSDHLDPLGRAVPTDNQNRALQLQYNQAEKLMMRQSSSTYRKPHRPAPNFQQQQRHSSSGMRAVFLGSRMGSAGTGVFLPRTYTESHTKPRCSTVLIPARVAQALMVHFDKMEARSSLQGGFPPQHAAAGGRSGQYLIQQKNQPEMTASAAVYDYDGIEFRLPQEWMY